MIQEKLPNKSKKRKLPEIALPVIETVSGILSSDKKDVVRSLGDSIQEFVKGNQWHRLGEEIKKFREAGKSNEEYFNNRGKQIKLLDLLKLFDENIPDDDVFRAMKSIFFSTISKDNYDEVLGYQLLKICKKLESGNILVLKACYDLKLKNELPKTNYLYDWENEISAHLCLPKEIVELHEQKLVEMKLLSPSVCPDRNREDVLNSVITVDRENVRLTTFGLKLCEFITQYPEE